MTCMHPHYTMFLQLKYLPNTLRNDTTNYLGI
jgi:hypothetical protein